MKKGQIIILSGPSGSGKTTFYKKLLKSKRLSKKLTKSISVTTRPRRSKERHGRDYFFVSHAMFVYKRRKGHFLESQKVFDNFYGTPKKSVQDLLRKGKNVLLCIDVKGTRVVSRHHPKAIKIFIKVPSLAELKKRLKRRGSENMATIKLRMETARRELKEADRYDYIVVNDDLSKAYRKLESILKAELDKTN